MDEFTDEEWADFFASQDANSATGLWGSDYTIGDIGDYIGDLLASGQITQDEAFSAMQAYNTAATTDPATGTSSWADYLANPDEYSSGSAGSTSPNYLSQLLGMASSPTGTGLLGAGVTALGSYLQNTTATDAASQYAKAQLAASQLAAESSKFKPVGVTTNFGKTDFGYDVAGNLIRAGYTLTPQLKAQQDALMAASGGMLNQFTGSQAATAPMSAAAQAAMGLGNQYLATDPAAQAKKYYDEQMALLAPTRERDYANLESRLAAQGRLGLATGGTSTLGASNPEMEALMNAQRMQDLNLAAQATQGGMDYAKFGAGMVGTGGDLLKAMYGTQAGAFAPYQTALGGATTIEGLGQAPMDIGTAIGAKTSTSAANVGSILGQGMINSAATMVQPNSYSPWGGLLSGMGQQLQNYGGQQPQQQQFNPLQGTGYAY
jgi:hypothetical protein